MTTKTIQAWLLHKQWSGDTSARVSFFTRELGLIHCFCKGVRTPKKQAVLQAFTPLWVSLETRYGQFYSKTIESTSSSLPFSGTALFAALYLNEILYYVLKANDAEHTIFDAYLFTLKKLTMTQNRMEIESLLRRFEWTLLNACGYSFSLTHEAKTEEVIVANLFYLFIAGEGFVRHSSGIPGIHILALANDKLDEPVYLRSAKVIMRQAMAHLLGGREIKARSLYVTE